MVLTWSISHIGNNFMDIVKLIKTKSRGYILTIGDDRDFESKTWAVRSIELLWLLKILKKHEKEIRAEVEDIKEQEGML